MIINRNLVQKNVLKATLAQQVYRLQNLLSNQTKLILKQEQLLQKTNIQKANLIQSLQINKKNKQIRQRQLKNLIKQSQAYQTLRQSKKDDLRMQMTFLQQNCHTMRQVNRQIINQQKYKKQSVQKNEIVDNQLQVKSIQYQKYIIEQLKKKELLTSLQVYLKKCNQIKSRQNIEKCKLSQEKQRIEHQAYQLNAKMQIILKQFPTIQQEISRYDSDLFLKEEYVQKLSQKKQAKLSQSKIMRNQINKIQIEVRKLNQIEDKLIQQQKNYNEYMDLKKNGSNNLQIQIQKKKTQRQIAQNNRQLMKKDITFLKQKIKQLLSLVQ